MGEFADAEFDRLFERHCGRMFEEGERRRRREQKREEYEVRAEKSRAAPGSALAAARARAHASFDSLWKDGLMSRSEAYQWLAATLALEQDDAHIAFLDEVQCEELTEAANTEHFRRLL